MNISEDCQCEEDQLPAVEWTKHVLEETLIPVVGTVGLLGNTLTILVLNRYHIAQCNHLLWGFCKMCVALRLMWSFQNVIGIHISYSKLVSKSLKKIDIYHQISLWIYISNVTCFWLIMNTRHSTRDPIWCLQIEWKILSLLIIAKCKFWFRYFLWFGIKPFHSFQPLLC